MSAERLSKQQKHILKWIYARYEEVRRQGFKREGDAERDEQERRKLEDPEHQALMRRFGIPLVFHPIEESRRKNFECWGIRWRTDGHPSGRASLSRSLRELEARGLVMRTNQCSTSAGDRPVRATHVVLTEAGEQIAKLLTQHVTENVNS